MSTAERMLDSPPAPTGYDSDARRECIRACRDCAQAATAYADACLGAAVAEELTGGIRTLRTTADICAVTARVLSRRGGAEVAVVRALVGACWIACCTGRDQYDGCRPEHEHRRVWTRRCRDAERACRMLLGSLC